MAIDDRLKTEQRTTLTGRPDFAAISRRAVERNRLALAIIEAHDREGVQHVPQLRRAG
jgi:hypothetical protein